MFFLFRLCFLFKYLRVWWFYMSCLDHKGGSFVWVICVFRSLREDHLFGCFGSQKSINFRTYLWDWWFWYLGVMSGSKLVVSEIISSKINDRKLDGDKYLQWKRIIRLYLTGRGKDDHLTKDPSRSMPNDWKREDAMLFGLVLNTMEPRVYDLVIHFSIRKELWDYLQ